MMLSRCLPNHPAFLVRAAVRTGFSAFFGASLTVSLAVSLAARLPPPLIGNSISRWPAAAFFGFLPLAAAGAACFSLAKLRSFEPTELVSIGQAANVLKVTRPTIYRWMDDKALDYVRDDMSGRTFVVRQDVEAMKADMEAAESSKA